MNRQRILNGVTYVIPPAVPVILALVYTAFPNFYTKHILSAVWREGQVIELLTALSALGASVVLFRAVFLLRSMDRAVQEKRTGFFGFVRSARFPVLLAAIAVAVFFGEEINWGQNLFLLDLPHYSRPPEFNLHNRFSWFFTFAGELFLFSFFLAFPLMWRSRKRFRLPGGWSLSVPERAVSLSILIAYGWQYTKLLYLSWSPSADPASDRIYVEFFEQVNEHKEMLVAFSFLMYGLFRMNLLRRVPSA